ncbi:Putative glycosyltransferase EpsD [Crateriforma conspicua]|nr:Putative glycosyltransferase EpsD [Crateriforma conspicua]
MFAFNGGPRQRTGAPLNASSSLNREKFVRVLHVITRMIIGGAQENTLLNCLDLVQLYGDDVLLVTGPALGPEGDLISQGRTGDLPVRMIDSLRRNIHPLRDATAARQLRQVIRQYKPDVVHTHSAKGGMLGRWAGWAEKVPAVVHTVHGAPFHPYQPAASRRFFAACERWAAKRCHRLISVADAMTDLMVDACVAPREKFITIHSGMNVQPFYDADQHRTEMRRHYGFVDEDIVIGKIARLFHLKGHADLIESAKDVVAANARVKFLLVGDGILKDSLQRRVDELGLTKHFVFAGLVPPTDVPRQLSAMDGLAHTSYREGLARALPQALIAGRPVVSYDVDGAREVCISGETGFLVPPGDIEALTRALIDLAADPQQRQTMGNAGRSRFTDQFKHETMTRRIRDLYEELLAESGAHTGS